MKLKKKEAEFLNNTINHWQEKGLVDHEQAERLKSSYQTASFDWQGLAFYSFIIAAGCFIITMVALLADKWIISIFERIADSKDHIKFNFFVALSFLFYWLGVKKRNQKPEDIIKYGILFLLGSLSTATATVYLGLMLDLKELGHFPLIFLAGTFTFIILALYLSSRQVWTFGILAFTIWFGTETYYLTQGNPFFLGMNYPFRFVVFGILLVLGSHAFKKTQRLAPFYQPTYFTSLLILFTSSWLLSIFGNYGTWEEWYQASQVSIINWTIPAVVVSLGGIYYGLNYNNKLARDFGIVFLFLNLYTRYIEYGWPNMNKAIFFGVMALSFWFIGKKAEKIWKYNG
jgi:hypothetical protein